MASPITLTPAQEAQARSYGLTPQDFADAAAGRVTGDQLVAKSRAFLLAQTVAATRRQYAGSGLTVDPTGFVQVPLRGPFERGLSDLSEAAVTAPSGLAYAMQQARGDVGAALRGNLSFPHTRQLGLNLAHTVATDFSHPARCRW